MNQISQDDAVRIFEEFFKFKKVEVEGMKPLYWTDADDLDGAVWTEDCWEVGNEIDWLNGPRGEVAMIRRILKFAALHLEEIPKPEVVIMPFCDIAGKDDYSSNGETTNEALQLAILEMIKVDKTT